MKTKLNLCWAAVVAFLIGMPLAENASADSGSSIFGSSIDLARAIIEAAQGS